MTDPLTEPELRAVAADLAQSFETARELATLIRPGNSSHTSIFYELNAPGEGAPTALIKIGETGTVRGTADLPRVSWPFRTLLDEAGSPLGVASPMGWHAAPPSICVGYVAGDDLGRLLRGADRDSTGSSAL